MMLLHPWLIARMPNGNVASSCRLQAGPAWYVSASAVARDWRKWRSYADGRSQSLMARGAVSYRNRSTP